MGCSKSKLIMKVPLILNFCWITVDKKMVTLLAWYLVSYLSWCEAASVIYFIVSTLLSKHRVPSSSKTLLLSIFHKTFQGTLSSLYLAKSISIHYSIYHNSRQLLLCRSGPFMRLCYGQVQEFVLFLHLCLSAWYSFWQTNNTACMSSSKDE